MHQRIHLKHLVLFPVKNNEKIFMNVVCCSRDWRFKGLVFFRMDCMMFCCIHECLISMHKRLTVQILYIGTDRSQQTVQTKIRLLLKKQSDQGLHCLPFHQQLLECINAMLHQTFLVLGELWQLFEVSQILEFLRYFKSNRFCTFSA